jgi:hypothetical protein
MRRATSTCGSVDATIAAMAQIGLTPSKRLSTAHTITEPTNTLAAKRQAMAPWCGKLGPVAVAIRTPTPGPSLRRLL